MTVQDVCKQRISTKAWLMPQWCGRGDSDRRMIPRILCVKIVIKM